MIRQAIAITIAGLLLCTAVANADLSSGALYIQNADYKVLSTENPIGSITSSGIQKASAIVPSISDGLVVWADGRSGVVNIVGYDLNTDSGEFLISSETDGWQEGNPYAAYSFLTNSTTVVYDAVNITNASGDQGNITGYNYSTSTTTSLVTSSGIQYSPVLANANSTTYLGWMYDTETPDDNFPAYNNTQIYVANMSTSTVTNITAGVSAPRESLSAGGSYLVWQEMQSADVMSNPTWNIGVYNLATSSLTYIASPNDYTNLLHPDVDGDLAVFTAEDTAAATTNIYFKDLTSSGNMVAITTTGSADYAAISKATYVENGSTIEAYFVVWQDHRADNSTSFYAGGNGETDYNWDIWGQELRYNSSTGQWELYGDAFAINTNVADSAAYIGRQTRPDIDGLNVVWQSQAPNSEDIYVWGAVIPEPTTMALVLLGIPLTAAVRRRNRLGKK